MIQSKRFSVPAKMSAQEVAKTMYVYLVGACALEAVWDGNPQEYRSHGPWPKEPGIWELNAKGDVRLIVEVNQSYLETTDDTMSGRMEAMVGLFVATYPH